MNGIRKSLLLSLLFLIIVNIILFTVSKYSIKNINNLDIVVGKPIISLENNNDLVITNDVLYNSQSFNIMNYTNNKVNEVSLSYYFEIIYTNIDYSQVEITLTRNGKSVIITDNITEKFPLQTSERQVDKFLLSVEYKVNQKEDMSGNIELKLHYYQNVPEVSS